MKDLIKLNNVSVLYALSLFISIELMINVYRISRITGWHFDIVIMATSLISFIVIMLFTVLIIWIIKKWHIERKISNWSIFSWFPYFIFFYIVYTYFFPLSSGETWFPIFHLLIYGVLIIYPIYIWLINLYATTNKELKTGKGG